ncbi:MAG TPA: HTH domain-containing protein [Solirubrobacteraceae bacterium]|nr:HTH domain-containing protein [Solirubrobacteraceae bacterium]
MTGDEERQLVEALAELLVEWVEARPERLPAGLRTGGGCDLDGCSRGKEQPFEAGTMPEDTCAPRIATLSEQAKALEDRASELAARHDDEQPERATAADLDALRGDLRAALNDSTPTRVKGVLQTMIDTIRVDARDQIEPTFRVPAVRIDYGYMDLVRTLSNPTGPLKTLLEGTYWIRQDSKRTPIKRSKRPRPTRPGIAARHRRAGWVVEAIVRVLAERQEPMQAKEVHAAVEALLGEPVRWASVKAALAANVVGPSPRFVRVGRGRYRLA